MRQYLSGGQLQIARGNGSTPFQVKSVGPVEGPTRSTPRHGPEARAAFAINYRGNPAQDDRSAAPAPQV
jgi:hypothetical protein